MQVKKPTDRSVESLRLRRHLMIDTNQDQSRCLRAAAPLLAGCFG